LRADLRLARPALTDSKGSRSRPTDRSWSGQRDGHAGRFGQACRLVAAPHGYADPNVARSKGWESRMATPPRSSEVLGGRYRLTEPIGRGGSSVVWRAHDEVLDRDVAVKILAAGGERYRRRLRTEAMTAGRLRNPHVAHVYDYGEHRSGTGN